MRERKQGLGMYTGREKEGVWMCRIRETYQRDGEGKRMKKRREKMVRREEEREEREREREEMIVG